MPDEMKRIVVCRHCGRLEYYGEMGWLSGRCSCRACYREDYKDRTGEIYKWNDLDGPVPTQEEYIAQQAREEGQR